MIALRNQALGIGGRRPFSVVDASAPPFRSDARHRRVSSGHQPESAARFGPPTFSIQVQSSSTRCRYISAASLNGPGEPVGVPARKEPGSSMCFDAAA